MKNIVILISGRGSNMESVVRAAQAEQWPARIAAVISNKADAPGLAFARAHGIATAVVPSAEFASRAEFDAALQQVIDQFCPDLVVLAGFMRILTVSFVAHYAGRMLNIHPSLLPAFPGLHTHQQALAAGVAWHGASVHLVTAEIDHGPLLGQAQVAVLAGDTEASLSARVLEQEHLLYPRVIRAFLEGRSGVDSGPAATPT
ncbi:MAG: phosphoribosylglycinamide formyltransferase [Massilia sp.]|nr:phosphoribosylglycinamide formyltransferase [Massilia sp.]